MAVPSLPLAPRRAVFIDVENTSSENSLLAVIEHLKIDRTTQPTELIAAGNWKSVGAKVARMLAGLGAQLVHSAPASGVRDWSDLWIAVSAGRWLALARPGDTIEIVSDDRAFDAVGDAAAAAGVVFHRISYRSIIGVAPAIVVSVESTARPRRRRGGRRHGRSAVTRSQPPASAAPVPAVAVEAPTAADVSAQDAAHAASLAHIRATLERLSGSASQWINLDTIANALREEGFTRPPGSPRLITRLRALKDVEVTPTGMVRYLTETGTSTTLPAASGTDVAPTRPAGPRRPRRRGGRGRRRSSSSVAPAPNDATESDVSV